MKPFKLFIGAMMLCLSAALISVSCTNSRSSNYGSSSYGDSSSSQSKRDAGKEFRSITERTGSSLDSALRDVDDFISEFRSDDEAWEYVDDMKEIRSELNAMEKFFNKNFYSYKQFLEAAEEVASRFEGSDWPIVRNVWKSEFKSKDNAWLREEMNKIDANSFRSYMIEDAENRCLENFESYGPVGIGYMLSRSHSTEVISIDEPESLDGLSGKKTEGVFRVHMEGSLGMGHRVGTIKIRIKGELGITTEGDLQYHKLDYDILERTGSLQ